MPILKTTAIVAAGALALAYVAGQFSSRTLVTEIEIDAPRDAV